ncbi:MAG: AbrB/MazE/SpoVT family DNA-binding domain-containing protein [Anaerolineae bacterium]|jgi:bifunctional DNA-binding transcriptional regulator/antitoxin component of YhaV-PrlF toxin-antitoxin module|nr:AbrB/MazE/SpoVT family DNA-binding domain-containing protein [Anaerolineae bacterium]
MANIQIRSKGSITLPVNLRNKYDLNEGDVFSLIDMGDGSFLLTPKRSEITRLGEKVATVLDAENISLDELLNGLDEERERYYQDRYAHP